jgi:hypothetical protein
LQIPKAISPVRKRERTMMVINMAWRITHLLAAPVVEVMEKSANPVPKRG